MTKRAIRLIIVVAMCQAVAGAVGCIDASCHIILLMPCYGLMINSTTARSKNTDDKKGYTMRNGGDTNDKTNHNSTNPHAGAQLIHKLI